MVEINHGGLLCSSKEVFLRQNPYVEGKGLFNSQFAVKKRPWIFETKSQQIRIEEPSFKPSRLWIIASWMAHIYSTVYAGSNCLLCVVWSIPRGFWYITQDLSRWSHPRYFSAAHKRTMSNITASPSGKISGGLRARCAGAFSSNPARAFRRVPRRFPTFIIPVTPQGPCCN